MLALVFCGLALQLTSLVKVQATDESKPSIYSKGRINSDLLLSYGIARTSEPYNLLERDYGAEVTLVNNTKGYLKIILYVDGEGCGAAPRGDYCTCPVRAGVSHNLKAVGYDSAGKTDSATRSIPPIAEGDTFTWTISED